MPQLQALNHNNGDPIDSCDLRYDPSLVEA